MELTLERRWQSPAATIGELSINGTRECYILEDKVREVPGIPVAQWKIQDATAIPAGRYKVIADYSLRFKRITLRILNVPGFTGIRIHPGNIPANTDGCLLPGLDRDGAIAVMRSKIACNLLEAKVIPAIDNGDSTHITIHNPPGPTPEEMAWPGG